MLLFFVAVSVTDSHKSLLTLKLKHQAEKRMMLYSLELVSKKNFFFHIRSIYIAVFSFEKKKKAEKNLIDGKRKESLKFVR